MPKQTHTRVDTKHQLMRQYQIRKVLLRRDSIITRNITRLTHITKTKMQIKETNFNMISLTKIKEVA